MGNPGEFPAQMASNAENISIWWRHHDIEIFARNFTDDDDDDGDSDVDDDDDHDHDDDDGYGDDYLDHNSNDYNTKLGEISMKGMPEYYVNIDE